MSMVEHIAKGLALAFLAGRWSEDELYARGRPAIHIPTEVYLAAMKEPVPPNPEVFDPLKKSRFGDRVAVFFDDLLWAARALKSAREARGRGDKKR